ncbi:PAS domain S-box protein, partial [Candidatus Poribacteria bacterium]|nr:PAS domain S-box protein [Candidatus Poribacteria bacterium]
ILDALGRAVIEWGGFRSLMLARVDEDAGQVTVDRDFVEDAAGAVVPGGQRGHTVAYALDDADPVAEAARTGRLVVIVGADDRLCHGNADAKASYPDDKVAYFIPVMRDDRVLAVLATASTRAEEEDITRRIVAMESLLRHAGAALDHARVYQAMAAQREELRAVVAGARCLLWQSQVTVAPVGQNGEPRLEWDIRVSDEEAAQRFLPLDISDGRSYIEAWDDAMGPYEVARVAEVARTAILAGESSYEVQFRCTDATGARRWISEQVFVEPKGDGRLQSVAVCSDITPWKTAEEALRDSEARFRRVFTQGPLGMAVVGRDFRLVNANDMLCGMLGYSREELRTMRFADFTHPDDIAIDVELTRQVFAGEIPHYTVEKRYLRKDGKLLWGKLTATVVSGTPAETANGLNMIEDVTDHKRAEDQLRDMHAQLERRIEERTAQLEDQLAERIRVEGALRTTERERTRLMQDVLSVQEEERTRIARELHDQTGQALSSLLIGLRVVEGASSLDAVRQHAIELREVTAQALDGVRTLAFDMRPTSLENLGLSAGVERDASALGSQLNIAVHVHADGRVDGVLSRDAETALYRVIRAALTNIAHHAAATTVSILLRRRGALVTALVEDDGVGFDVEKTLAGPIEGRFGLLAMEERVRPFGGVVSFESTRGVGATVYVQMPSDLVSELVES